MHATRGLDRWFSDLIRLVIHDEEMAAVPGQVECWATHGRVNEDGTTYAVDPNGCPGCGAIV